MRSKTKSKATKPKEEDKTQSERFIEAAREIEADETGTAFNIAVNKILHTRTPPRRASTPEKPE